MLDLINPYIAKIIIAAKDGDSIRQISKKIQESYGWTYKWVYELKKIGVIKRKKQEIYVYKKHSFYKAMITFIKNTFAENFSLSDAYVLPNLAGLEYMFTNTDAVFIWTKGGYNIGRSKDSYPIFIEILEKDIPTWTRFFSRLKIAYTFKNQRKKGIYFVITISKSIEKEFCDEIPVLPLSKTVAWARQYEFNFQPALEILDELYNLKLGLQYAEK